MNFLRGNPLILCAMTLGMTVGCQTTPKSDQTAEPVEMSPDRDPAPQSGEQAPVFTLRKLDGTGTVGLAQLKAERPILLLFGSYT